MDDKMSIIVPPEGSEASKIVLIGEAPAREEVNKSRPFVGSAGQYLDNFIKMSGLFRGELYLTNILKHRAPGDKLARVPFEELQQARRELIDEINSLEDVKVIVPLGKYPMETVTNHRGITNFRGSPLRPIDDIKHDCVVIPIFHPSRVHYAYRDTWPYIVADLGRVKRIKDNNFEFQFPEENFIIRPTFDRVMDTLDWLLENKDQLVVIDVENPHRLLSAIGLGWSKSGAICIPFYMGNGSNYWSFEQELLIWQKLGEVLPQLNLGGQNVMYDWEVMSDHHITLKIPYYDSMLMHACLYSELPHNLAMIASIYTDFPFWKRDEDEDLKLSGIRAGREEEHWHYNCLDCCATWWAIETLNEELIEERMDGVYKELFADLIPIIYEMNQRGIRVDMDKLPAVRQELRGLIEAKQNKIREELGYDINVNSYKQVRQALFEQLGMTPYRNKEGKISTDKKALEKLAYKYNSDVPSLIAEAREDMSFVGMFDDENIENGRFRTRYTLSVTRTGRLSSRKTIGGKGRNLQNVKTGKARSFFLPEEGHLMVGGDERQAEARFVAYLSQDEAYIAAAESGQIHFMVCRDVFGEEISKDDPRYTIGKSLVHGADYGLGPWGFAYASGLPYTEAKEKLDAFHDTYPGIKQTFYKHVEEQIRKTRTVYNVFGRRLVVFDYINESTFRLGYAFIPQSSVADITKFALKKISKHFQVLMELHDGIYISVPEKELKYGIEAMREAYNVPFKVWGQEHTIPVEIKIGKNWNAMEEVE